MLKTSGERVLMPVLCHQKYGMTMKASDRHVGVGRGWQASGGLRWGTATGVINDNARDLCFGMARADSPRPQVR